MKIDRLLGLFPLLLMFPVIGSAQITGVIVDHSNIPIKGATVQIKKQMKLRLWNK